MLSDIAEASNETSGTDTEDRRLRLGMPESNVHDVTMVGEDSVFSPLRTREDSVSADTTDAAAMETPQLEKTFSNTPPTTKNADTDMEGAREEVGGGGGDYSIG